MSHTDAITSKAGPGENDVAMLEKLRGAHKQLRNEIGKVIIGQEAVLDQLLMASPNRCT
jgi:MoxR-like ATPase